MLLLSCIILIRLNIIYALVNRKNRHCYYRKTKYRRTAFTKYFSFYREIKKKENCKLQKLSPTETLQTECKKSFGGAKKNEEETFFFLP